MNMKTVLITAAFALAVSAPAATPVTPLGIPESEAVTAAQGQWHKHHGKKKRRKKEKYIVTDFDVFYGGRKVEGASAMSFKVLGRGYAKDDFGAYYKGSKIAGASAMSFKVLEDGYAKDDFNTYYKGRKISN